MTFLTSHPLRLMAAITVVAFVAGLWFGMTYGRAVSAALTNPNRVEQLGK